MDHKSMSSGRFFQLLYLAGFTLFIVRLLITGEVGSYVHPRFVPFLWAAAAVSLLIIAVSLRREFRSNAPRLSWKRIVILFIPVLFAFTVPAEGTAVTADESALNSAPPAAQSPDALPEPVVLARASGTFPLDEAHF